MKKAPNYFQPIKPSVLWWIDQTKQVTEKEL